MNLLTIIGSKCCLIDPPYILCRGNVYIYVVMVVVVVLVSGEWCRVWVDDSGKLPWVLCGHLAGYGGCKGAALWEWHSGLSCVLSNCNVCIFCMYVPVVVKCFDGTGDGCRLCMVGWLVRGRGRVSGKGGKWK